MTSGSLWHALAASLLAAGAVLLATRWELMGIEPPYLALMLIGISLVSFMVGYVMGYLTEDGLAPGSEERE